MKQRTLGAVGLLWLAFTTVAAAQDGAVLLRYHFQPGQEFRYRLTLSGDMAMNMGGTALPAGATVPPRIPITLNGTYEMVQKIKSVAPDGSATISLGLDKMEMTTGMMGMSIVARLGADGKMQTLMNGPPMTIPGAAPPTAFPNPLYETTVDPTGKMSGVTADSAKAMSQLFGGQSVAGMFNGGMPGMAVLLPPQAIKPGGTWNTKWDMKVPIPMPGPGGGAVGGVAGTMAVSFLVQNKLAKVEEGRAFIDTQITAAVPKGMKLDLPTGQGGFGGMSMRFEKMDQSMTGTYRFLVDQGAIEGGDLNTKIAMTMALTLPQGQPSMAPPPSAKPSTPKHATRARRGKASAATPRSGVTPAPQAANAGGKLKIDVGGTMKMTIDRVNAPEAAAAP